MPLKQGEIVEGKVKRVAPFGAFVEVNGETGLVHISEISIDYVQDINDYVKVGDNVKVKVMSLEEKGKINLSIKKVLEEERKKSCRPAEVDWSANANKSNRSFEDMLSKFKQESDKKISSLKLTKEPRKRRGQQ